MTSANRDDTTRVNDAPDEAAGSNPAPAGEATVCPGCSYTAEGTTFKDCPKCGLILSKYRGYQQVDHFSVPVCPGCGRDPGIRESFCPHCGESLTRDGGGLLSGKTGMAVASIVVIALLVFGYARFMAQSNGPPAGEPAQKTGSSNPAMQATSRTDGSSGPAVNQPVDALPGNVLPPAEPLPNAMPNSLGITKIKIAFTPGDNNARMPAQDSGRISLQEKRIYAHIKIVIPAERTYQFSGKFYDGDGKLVMNVPLSITPKVSVWYFYYYHDMDRSADRPGTWKFHLFGNGEQIAEEQVEVTES